MNEFSRMNRKNVIWLCLTVAAALAAGSVLLYFYVDGVWQDPFANFCVRIFRMLFKMDRSSAVHLYYRIFQDNKTYWVLAGFVVLLLLCMYLSMSRFNRYFRQTSAGVDQLLGDSAQEIRLPDELDFMERKLNTVKQTLERRARESAEAERRKNDLVMYLAHDIKTPLTSVVGYLSLLDEAREMPAELREKYINITLEKACRLEELIDEFFEITRFNLQSIPLTLENLDIPYLLLQMKEEFYPMLEPGGRSVALKADEGLRLVGDGDKLARVFNNILKNAVAYSDEGSEIRINAHRVGEQVEISFANQGRGIPQEELDRVFEKFYRLDGARSSNTGGAGLGLAIAKEIVSAHGGSVTAGSNEGRTVFSVILPSGGPPGKKEMKMS